MLDWIRSQVLEWLGINRLNCEVLACAKAIIKHKVDVAEELRQVRKDVTTSKVQRDIAHPTVQVIDWETAEAINLNKLLTEESIKRS
jgi:hypothetical protein